MLENIIQHRACVMDCGRIPQHILQTSEKLWRVHNKTREFLETNCELTTFAIRDMLTPHCADTHWTFCQRLCEPWPRAFQVAFGAPGQEHHFFFVLDGHVYQSYAFEHGVQQSALDTRLPLWRHVSCDAEQYRDMPVYFLTCSKNV